MKVETTRFVSDRYEWVSLAQRAPSLYHRWEWAEQSRRRVATLLPHLRIEIAYLRVWVDHALVACPLLLIDDVWFNVPRSNPVVLEGGPIDPCKAIQEATEEGEEVEIVDDLEQLEQIEAVEWELQSDSDDHRSRRSLMPIDVEVMRSRLSFASDLDEESWFEGVMWADRSGLDCRFVEFRRNDEPIGWNVHSTHLGETVLLAAAHVERIVDPWTSPR